MSDFPAVVVLGIVTGLQAALLGMGLVLIYRASRFINFAQGQMGAIAAAVLATLVFRADLPYWPALLIALMVGALTGAAVERLLSWRLFEASRLTLLVATIGVAQLVLLGVVSGPLKVDAARLATQGYPEPFHVRWTLGSVILNSSQVATIVIAPLLAVALFAFLSRTTTGKAIRAAASNPDAARLAGISVRRVSLVVWVVAGLVSAVAAILFAPSQPAIAFGNASPGLLLRALAAALLAGMYDFRLAAAAAIGLGIAEQATVFYTDVAGLADVVVAASLVLGLLVRARALTQGGAGADTLVVERSRPSLPKRVQHLLVVRHMGGVAWAALFGLLLVAPLLPGLRTQERAVFLVFIISFAIVGLGLTVLTGWGGQVSLGQFAFLGVGAYAAAAVDRHELGVPVMLLGGGLAAAFASVVVGLAAVRLRGLFLGVVTLGFAFVAQGWLFRQNWMAADRTELVTIEHPHLLGVRLHTVRGVYVVAVVVLLLVVLALRSLRASSVGRALVAVRDNDALASAFGLTPFTTKLIGLAIAGFVTGVAGGLWAMAQQTWSFAAFDPSMSFVLLSAAIVGGLGTLHGPILGAIAVFAWPYLVPDANTLAVRSFSSGLLLLAVLLFLRGGLADVVERVRQRLVALVARFAREPFVAQRDERPLVVRQLSMAFGGLRAVDEVSLHVDRGEVVGLIGGNGAGKSTLLNCVTGHLRASDGRVVIAGKDVTDLPPEFRPYLGVGRTFQEGRLFPGLTVLETVMAAIDRTERGGALAALTGAPWLRQSEDRKRRRAMDVLASVGLADRATTLTGELSTGMRRVCDLAAVVAAQPVLVILDEPTAGLAQREVEAFAPLLRRLRDERDFAILVVEHDVALLMSLCDRMYCLEEGRIIAEGTPDEIRADPRVIASYLGTDDRVTARSGT